MADFVTVLGIPGCDLAALTGDTSPPDAAPKQDPAAAELAGLLWDLRQLTADQVRRLKAAIRTA